MNVSASRRHASYQPIAGALSNTPRPKTPLFGHQHKPQPENTAAWLKMFGKDLFHTEKPCQGSTCSHHAHQHTPLHQGKNVFQKLYLWLGELVSGFFKDLKHVGKLLTQDREKASLDSYHHAEPSQSHSPHAHGKTQNDHHHQNPAQPQ